MMVGLNSNFLSLYQNPISIWHLIICNIEIVIATKSSLSERENTMGLGSILKNEIFIVSYFVG
jgi:hypothetical protein